MQQDVCTKGYYCLALSNQLPSSPICCRSQQTTGASHTIQQQTCDTISQHIFFWFTWVDLNARTGMCGVLLHAEERRDVVMGCGVRTHCVASVLLQCAVSRLLSGKRQMLRPHVVHISCSRSRILSQHCVLHQLLQTRTTASTHEA